MSAEPSVDPRYGVPIQFDANFKGPLSKRSCTDILCLFFFVLVIICWVVVAIWAFRNGDPARLLVPTDSSGQKCGVDPQVKDKPYLFYFDLTKCIQMSTNLMTSCPTTQVCRKSCPTTNFYYKSYTQSSGVRWEELNANIICKDNITKISDVRDLQYKIDNGLCAPWHLNSRPELNRCIPVNETLSNVVFFATLTEVNKLIHNFLIRFTNDKDFIEFGHMVVQDVSNSWEYIVGGLCLAMALSLIYVILMRWFAAIMVWFSLIGVSAVLSYCIYATYTQYKGLVDAEAQEKLISNDPMLKRNVEANIEVVWNKTLADKNTWLVLMIISAVVLAIIVLMVIFLRNRIRIAVALICESSKAVGSTMSTVFFPLVPWALQSGVIFFSVCLGLYLASTSVAQFRVVDTTPSVGTRFSFRTCNCSLLYKIGDACKKEQFESSMCEPVCQLDCQFSKYGTPDYIGYLHVFNIFCCLWAMSFVSALGDIILALTFATWYWTFNKSDVPFFTLAFSIGRVIRYHLGTVAFGALILAICQFIRLILEYIDHKLNKFDNPVVKGMLCCLKCCFWCLEKFIKFINRNAFIMCAIYGKNFCASARDAFNLLMRNIIRVFVVDKVTDFLLFMGKLLVIAGVCALSFYFFSGDLEVSQNKLLAPKLNYFLTPVVIICIGSYFVTRIFFGVYAMAVDTLFLCFLEDSERNDGSTGKPYFMSKNLMKILGKKNTLN